MSAYIYPREWIRGLSESELESLFERAGEKVEVIGLQLVASDTPIEDRIELSEEMEKAKVERWLLRSRIDPER